MEWGRIGAFAVAAAACVGLPWGVAAADGISAKKGFARIQETPAEDLDALRALYPSSIVERSLRTPAEQDAWRTALHARLKKVQVLGARESVGLARVRVRDEGGATAEIPLRYDDGQWVLDTAREQVIEGGSLEKANGEEPATVTLTTRRTNDAYGTSAFSFAHVTRKDTECLNRMDVWYCHNHELHFSGGGGAILTKAKALAKVKEVPMDVEWQPFVTPKKGQVYVIHARRPGHRDFYVRARILSVGEHGIELEWNLLSTGEGSPPSIHEASPIQSNDGADGTDGLCGKGGGWARR
jgi:hypothetical protein